MTTVDDFVALPVWGIRNTIISIVTTMMSGVFQAMNRSGNALAVSIVQAIVLVGSAALLAFTRSTTLVWFAFPISEIVILAIGLVFLKNIYVEQLGGFSLHGKLVSDNI